MIAIRKAWWATLLLTAFVGCGNEEPAGENPPPTPPASSDAAPAPDVTAPPAEGKPAETLPPVEPATPKESMPKEAAPSDEGLKLDGPAVTPPSAEKKEGDEASTGLTAAEIAELASLSAADKDIALKQVVCPVSGEHLGSMGAPLKVSAEGKTFMICCKGCNGDVKENPKEVVAKLKN